MGAALSGGPQRAVALTSVYNLLKALDRDDMLNEPLRKLWKLARLLHESRYRRGLRYGVAAAIEHSSVLSALDCATVVDVGANIGQFALAARTCIPRARVIAFEPLAQPARLFRRVFEGDAKVELHQLALGAESATIEMHVAAQVASSSILPITSLQSRIFPGTYEESAEPVRVEPLETVIAADTIQPPALLKLDVQGFELQVLQGCGALLQRFAHVYVECSFVELYENQALASEVVRYLCDSGFLLSGIYNVRYHSGRSVQGDFLFRNRNVH